MDLATTHLSSNASAFAARPSPQYVAVAGGGWGAVVAAVDAGTGELFAVELRSGAAAQELEQRRRADAFVERCVATAASSLDDGDAALWVGGPAPVPLRVNNAYLEGHAAPRCPVFAAEIWDASTRDAGPVRWCFCALFGGKFYGLSVSMTTGSPSLAIRAAQDFTGVRSAVANFHVAFLSKHGKRSREGAASEMRALVTRAVEQRRGNLAFVCGSRGGLAAAKQSLASEAPTRLRASEPADDLSLVDVEDDLDFWEEALVGG